LFGEALKDSDSKMAQKRTLKEFEAVFPKLEEVVLDNAKQIGLPQQYLDWFRKVCWPKFESVA
jgi:hypothetical protein